MSRFIRQNADVEIRGITFGQFYRNACDRFEYYGGDPEAAAQNFCCELEKMMGIFPNTSPSEPKDAEGRLSPEAAIFALYAHDATKRTESEARLVINRLAKEGIYLCRITRTAPSGAKPGEGKP